MSSTAADISTQINQLGLAAVPSRFCSREGIEIDSSSDEWVVATTSRVSRLNFARIDDERISWVCKRYVVHRMQIASTGDGVGSVSYTHLDVYKRQPKPSPFGSDKANTSNICG